VRVAALIKPDRNMLQSDAARKNWCIGTSAQTYPDLNPGHPMTDMTALIRDLVVANRILAS